jgi:hypothetical protein
VSHLNRVSANETRGGGCGLLIALSPTARSRKHKYEVQFCNEPLRIKLITLVELKLLIGNHYFPHGTTTEVISNCLKFLKKLGKQNVNIIMLGNLSTDLTRNIVCSHWTSEGAIYTSTCLLSLHQCTDAYVRSHLLAWSLLTLDSGIVKPDTCHHCLVIDIF